MKYTIYQSDLDRVREHLRRYRWIVIGLCALITLQMISIARLINHERIIVSPPVIHQDFWVSHNAVSDSYLVEMSQYFAQALLNVTPQIVERQIDLVLHYVDPQQYATVHDLLQGNATRIKRENISSVFYPADITVERDSMRVELTGDLRLQAGQGTPIIQRKTYLIEYGYHQGRLWIKQFSELLTSELS